MTTDVASALVVACAPNGARRTKADHPALPMTADELARTAAQIADAGAAMIHIHVRDKDGRHLLDAEAYREATTAIRAEVGKRLVIQATSEAGGLYGPDAQMAVIRELHPEAVSVALREIVADAAAEVTAAAFFAWLARERIGVQVILYTDDEVRRFAELTSRGVLGPGPHWPLFVLGRYVTGQRSQPVDLLPFLAAAEAAGICEPWAMCAFGPREAACAMAAATLGGDVRVGFENNLWLPDGSLAPDNAALVQVVADGARVIGRRLASADELRARMGGG